GALRGESTVAEAGAAADAVCSHATARMVPSRLRVATMAARVLRWLSHAEQRPTPASFVDAVLAYRDDDAWADQARTAIRAGDRSPAMAESCRRLAERALAFRERGNREFATLLAPYTTVGKRDERIVPVEDIVVRVVAPLASTPP